MTEGGRISKTRALVVGVSVVTVAIITAVVFMVLPVQSTRLTLGKHTYTLQIARTAVAQARGLGDRNSLPVDEGMLFPYSHPQNLCFWMKDMHFPLDIIWVSPEKKVVNIIHNLSPSSYPQAYCATAQYVIELNAGQANLNNIAVGQQLSF